MKVRVAAGGVAAGGVLYILSQNQALCTMPYDHSQDLADEVWMIGYDIQEEMARLDEEERARAEAARLALNDRRVALLMCLQFAQPWSGLPPDLTRAIVRAVE